MGSVHPIRTEDSLDEFFAFTFGEQRGFAYSPTKNPITHDFEQYFFQWPDEKEALIEHVRRFSPTHEVYYAPALYSQRSAEKDDFLGTYFVWAEFDGTLPNGQMAGLPEPSVKIQSSTEAHEHWYWRLEYFVTDRQIVEDISQRLTYHLQADLSAWNSNRVLRPPNTIHHESSRQTTILRWDPRPIKIQEFVSLPELSLKILGEDDIHHVPNALDVIFKYSWKQEDVEFFKTKEIKAGTGKGRSAALAKLGHICMEMGMTNAETLSLLMHADNRWKKYAHRRDQKIRLLGIINHCRSKHPVDAVEEQVESPLKVYSYEEFMTTPIEIEWVVKDFIHKKGLIVVFGQADVGKSQISLRFAEALAQGSKFLKWPIERKMKTLFISMEMHSEELQLVLRTMKMGEDSDPDLRENMLLMPLGSSIKLNSKIAQDHLNRVIEEYQPDGVIFDSLGVAISDNLSSEEVAFKTLDYVNDKIRREYGAFAWFIHHPRKEQPNNRKPNRLSDMYGSGYFGNEATNVFTLWPSGPAIDVSCLKMRLAPQFAPFKIRRTSTLNFEVVEGIKINHDKPIFDDLNNLGESI